MKTVQMSKTTRLGNMFIYGPEEVLRGNNMVLLMKFNKKLNHKKLQQAFDALYEQFPQLKVKWCYYKEEKRYNWQPLSQTEFAALMKKEQKILEKTHKLEHVVSQYFATENNLPLKVFQVDSKTVVFSVNHVFTNGQGIVRLARQFAAFYHDKNNILPVEDKTRKTSMPGKTKYLLLAILYLAAFKIKQLGRGRYTVNLSNGKPVQHKNGYTVLHFTLSENETASIIKASRQKKLSLTQFLCMKLTETMFAVDAQASRVLVSIPVDLNRYSGKQVMSPGNATGSHLAQFYRGEKQEQAVKKTFRWLRAGVPYGQSLLLSFFCGDESRVKENYIKAALEPLAERSGFVNYSCSLSNMGALNKHSFAEIDYIAPSVKTQTISFAMMTLHNRLTMTITYANDLFVKKKIESLQETFKKQLLVTG